MLLIQLSEAHRKMALSETNRFYAWKALGCPSREVTTEEAVTHFLEIMSQCVFASGSFEVEPREQESPMFV